mmetsp:Transcript_20703/g.39375  ORF Transcript_20703/g.39375 Transcript_20703/m.39375 type:complete len:329 (+) Transcript_20703:129-1115(+)
MGKIKVMSRASEGKARFGHDSDGAVVREPGPSGNVFDVVMAEEDTAGDLNAVYKIVDMLKDKGVCLVEADASTDVLTQAYCEADALWESGSFGPPLQVQDESMLMEAELWNTMLYKDDPKVYWVKMDGGETDPEMLLRTEALRVLSQHMLDFANDIREILAEETGVLYTHFWSPMLTCYTGNRTYNLHLDNPHGSNDSAIPDNGLRVAITYYINPCWNPVSGYNGGGLDIHLTDPLHPPTSLIRARSTEKIRVAPHADTMVFFLAERMAHQVIETRGREKIFSMTMWCINDDVAQDFLPRVHALMRRQQGAPEARDGLGSHSSDEEVD